MKNLNLSSGNKKKDIIIISILIIVLLGVGVFSFIHYSNKSKPEEKESNWQTSNHQTSIVIRQYVQGTNTILRETSNNDVDLVSSYFNQLEELSADEMVDLAVSRDLEITYENITVQFQLNQKDYCYVIDQSLENEYEYLSKLPSGFYDYVVQQIEKVEKKDVPSSNSNETPTEQPITSKSSVQIFNSNGVLNRTIPITEEEVNEIAPYISELKPAEFTTEIKENVVLVYEGTHRIGIDINNSQFCNLIVHNTGSSGIAKLPYELYEFILNKYNGN